MAPFRIARPLALALCLAAHAHADPWSASIGVPHRVGALRDPSPATRARAAWWLHANAPAAARRGAPQDPRVTLPIVLAHERDPAAALAEVAALSRWTRGSLEHGHRMLEVLGNGQVPEIARLAALRAFSLESPEERLTELIARATPLAVPGDPFADLAALGLAALPDALLSAALQQTEGQPLRRAGVLRAIGMRGDPRWSAPVLDALRPPRDLAQEGPLSHAIEAAESLRLAEAAPRLVALAEDDCQRSFRARATRALGALGGSFDPAVLIRLMEVPITRVAALEAAAAIGDPALARACARHLRDALAVEREAAARCVRAHEPIAAQGDPRDVPALVRALATADDEGERVRAANALGDRAGDPLARDALRALVTRERDLPSPAAMAALHALVRAGAPVDDATLIAWLDAQDPRARQSAAHAIGVLGGRTSAAALAQRAPAEHDDDARGAMAVALGRCLGEAAAPTLAAIDETAFSLAQTAMVAHARRLAAGGSRAPYIAQNALRRNGFAPGSVCFATLPDGGLAVAAADARGTVSLPEGAAAPRRR